MVPRGMRNLISPNKTFPRKQSHTEWPKSKFTDLQKVKNLKYAVRWYIINTKNSLRVFKMFPICFYTRCTPRNSCIANHTDGSLVFYRVFRRHQWLTLWDVRCYLASSGRLSPGRCPTLRNRKESNRRICVANRFYPVFQSIRQKFWPKFRELSTCNGAEHYLAIKLNAENRRLVNFGTLATRLLLTFRHNFHQ